MYDKQASIGGNLIIEPGTIRLNKMVLVEGQDEIFFIHMLLKKLEINDLEVREVEGKYNFKNKLPSLLRTPGFNKVQTIAIIRDADNDMENTFISTKNILEDNNLKSPLTTNAFSEGTPKTGIFIIKEMLEDLCLKTVTNHPVMECLNNYFNCIGSKKFSSNKLSKAKTQVFLAAMPKFQKSIGRGALKGFWDFNSIETDELSNFLCAI